MGRVDRFNDAVAISVGDGSTTYLIPSDAKKLAAAINACVKDIRKFKFGKSNFLPVNIPITRNALILKVKRKEVV